jgi:hypothetical protein
MLFADADTVAIVNTVVGAAQAVFLAILGVIGGYIAYKSRMLEVGQQKAAVKVDEVADKATIVSDKLDAHTSKTDKKLDGLSKVAGQTLNAVNGGMTVALESVSTLTAKEADRTGEPADIAAAKMASDALDQHRANEAEAAKTISDPFRGNPGPRPA